MFCKAWLAQSRRVLTTELRTTLLLSWAVDGSVLMLWLLFHVSRQWHSFQRAPLEIVGLSMAQIVETLVFEPLERKHGCALLACTFSLLCCARHGLAEEELMDLLSCNDTIQQARTALAPAGSEPVAPWRLRMAGSAWLALLADVRPICSVGGGGEGCRELLSVRHRFVAQALRARYLKHPGELAATHRALAEYFSGTWHKGRAGAGSQEPSLDGDRTLSLKSGMDIHVRGLAPQGNVLCEQPTLFNYRKFEELSHHMAHGRMVDECADLWFDVQWLETILAAMGAIVVLMQLAEVCALFAAESSLSIAPACEAPAKISLPAGTANDRNRQVVLSFEKLVEIVSSSTASGNEGGLSVDNVEALGCSTDEPKDELVSRLLRQLQERDRRAMELEGECGATDPEWFSDL
jgi:hypothetical protein